jgi:hypothetical protein
MLIEVIRKLKSFYARDYNRPLIQTPEWRSYCFVQYLPAE